MGDSPIDNYVANHEERTLDDLFTLLAQPSVSATGEGVQGLTELAEEMCLDYGFDETQVFETSGQPAVVAQAHVNGDPDNDRPTVLIYGHYDVQPVDPDMWETQPFEPTIGSEEEDEDDEERIYARGAGDNTGQWFSHLVAVRGYRETGELPVNVTLFLDGEEEIGSPYIEEALDASEDLLEADVLYMADGPIDEAGRPQIWLGCRGWLNVQIEARGSNRDLHAGNYGGPIPNPAWELVWLLGTMKGPDGRIQIPGFYDDVAEPTDTDLELLAEVPFDPDYIRDELELEGFARGPGESYQEKIQLYPTLDITGFTSGYGGEGHKLVLPSRAKAKLVFNLVPNQKVDPIFENLEDHIEEHTTGTCEVNLTRYKGEAPAYRTPASSPYLKPIQDALSDVWGTEPVVKPSLGSPAPIAYFFEGLDIPCFIVPYANNDERNHAPDENLKLSCFRNGIHSTAQMLANVGDMDEQK